MLDKPFYTIPDLCTILPLGKNKLYDMAKRRAYGFPAIRIGRQYIVYTPDLLEWLRHRRMDAEE